MCRPNENTGGDRHVHAVIGYRDHKGKMQTYTSHPFLDLATVKRWWANFKHTWSRDVEVSYDTHKINERVDAVAAD